MINRVFFILEQGSIQGNLPLPDENMYYSIRADPSVPDALENAYRLIESSQLPGLALTLLIKTPLNAKTIRLFSSFLFLPAYLRIAGMPVIILAGGGEDLLREASASLSSYLSGQGFEELLIHTLPEAGNAPGYFRSVEELIVSYNQLLRHDPCFGNRIFFHASPEEPVASALAALQQADSSFFRESPQQYALIRANGLLEKELTVLRKKQAATEMELKHQQQYVEILRSDHAAKEIQDYYNREYEILPLWYKRFGQVLKVLTGKRTFKSLFRDGVKKYKD